jgi:phenol 2-monooxygenase (NADPH)
MQGEQTNSVWGVVDMIPNTNFPDIRNKAAIHSHVGSCINVPREGNMVRLYIQLDKERDITNMIGANGRKAVQSEIDIGPNELLEVRYQLHLQANKCFNAIIIGRKEDVASFHPRHFRLF